MGVFQKALNVRHHFLQRPNNSGGKKGERYCLPLKVSDKPFFLHLISSHEPTHASIVMCYTPLERGIQELSNKCTCVPFGPRGEKLQHFICEALRILGIFSLFHSRCHHR